MSPLEARQKLYFMSDKRLRPLLFEHSPMVGTDNENVAAFAFKQELRALQPSATDEQLDDWTEAMLELARFERKGA